MPEDGQKQKKKGCHINVTVTAGDGMASKPGTSEAQSGGGRRVPLILLEASPDACWLARMLEASPDACWLARMLEASPDACWLARMLEASPDA